MARVRRRPHVVVPSRQRSGLDQQRRELVQADLLERAAFWAGQDFTGVRVDVEVMVVLDEDSLLDDALDGSPPGVHPQAQPSNRPYSFSKPFVRVFTENGGFSSLTCVIGRGLTRPGLAGV